MMRAVTQEEMFGCAVAVVAFILKNSYRESRRMFTNPEYAALKGYYCRDIVKVLSKANKTYAYKKFNSNNEKLLNTNDCVVYIKKSKKYPAGHFLVQKNGYWMDPWINFPEIKPARGGFRKRLPSKPQWFIYPLK